MDAQKQKQQNGNASEPLRRLEEKVGRVGTSLQGLASRESMDELREALAIERRVNKHPFAMLAAALGVGYVIGGGLFSSATRRMLAVGLTLGLRAAAIPLIQEQFGALASGAGNGQQNSH
ncbi:MAG: hypothetical protein ACKVPX_09565 [Myxococcaceae bacterium]